MMDQFDFEEPWGQYVTIDIDIYKNEFKPHFPKYITPSDVNPVKYSPLLHSIKEEKLIHKIDRDSIVTSNNNNKYSYFTFGNICLRVINIYFYASRFYQSIYKKD